MIDCGRYGFQGISSGAAVIFFAYLGYIILIILYNIINYYYYYYTMKLIWFIRFDMVVNVAEETENPQRDLPIGILASLGISTTLCILYLFIYYLFTYYYHFFLF